MQLTDEGGFVRAIIDIGIPLSVLLTQQEYKRVRFLIGGPVALSCPPESIGVM